MQMAGKKERLDYISTPAALITEKCQLMSNATGVGERTALQQPENALPGLPFAIPDALQDYWMQSFRIYNLKITMQSKIR